mmetsp:Transcript_41479/g.88264  ORF Transcript_41479/g.88264 Transcript_41479/m.88264 type:complete len:362 (+) Transcript_41479:76-1161(+)
MERAWSVEDLVGGLWRMGERTTSDQQLQDYLRRVPSGSWPAASPGQQPSPEQFQQAQVQAAALAAVPHAQAQAQAAYAAQAAGMQQAMQAMAAGKAGELVQGQARAGGQNMQRVASLDMLRALVMQGPQGVVQSMPPPGSGMNAPPARGARPGTTNTAQQAGAGSSAGVGVKVEGVAGPVIDKNMDKSEIRRVRRMLSNRESARRSRRRKQEHLQTLEDKIRVSEQAKIEMEEKVKDLDNENKMLKSLVDRLQAENQRLRQNAGEAESKEGEVKVEEGGEEEAPPKTDSAETKSRTTEGGDKSEKEGRGEKRTAAETMKRKASFEELSKRLKSENDPGACNTLQNAHRESWQDLSAAEQVH